MSELNNGRALDRQVQGDHYKKYAIQPVEFCMKNNLDYCQSNVVKYVTRFRDKGGIEDLKKARHYIELLIEFEEEAKDDIPFAQAIRRAKEQHKKDTEMGGL